MTNFKYAHPPNNFENLCVSLHFKMPLGKIYVWFRNRSTIYFSFTSLSLKQKMKVNLSWGFHLLAVVRPIRYFFEISWAYIIFSKIFKYFVALKFKKKTLPVSQENVWFIWRNIWKIIVCCFLKNITIPFFDIIIWFCYCFRYYIIF